MWCKEENAESLEGIPEEDVQLIRHLTWLYGGYSMRTRKIVSFSQKLHQSDEEDMCTEANNSKLVNPKTREIRNNAKSKRAKAEGPKSARKKVNGDIVRDVAELNGPYPPEPLNLLPKEAGLREDPPQESEACTPETANPVPEVREDDKKATETDKPNERDIKDPYEEYYIRMVDTLVLDRRRPRWANGLSLKDKINKFLETGVATATEVCDGTPTTLSICSQFELSNHEAMVADVDRVHYYRAAIFWTGFRECKIDTAISATDKSEPLKVELTRDTSVLPNGSIAAASADLPSAKENKNYQTSRNGHTERDSMASSNRYYCSNKRVLEIGTGPMCVLAMNALNAGANYVDALEVSSSAARLASKLMSAYGVSNKIRVFNCHSKNFFFDAKSFFGLKLDDQSGNSEVDLPRDPPYDMIISEILGDFASQEGVADVFLDLQRRMLFNHPDYIAKVKSIPRAAATKFVPCVFPDADNVVNKSAVHEHTTIFTPTYKMLQSVGLRIDNLPLCDQWETMEQLNFEKWMQPQMCQHYESMFHISSSGPMCGFLSGIDVEIRPDEHFGTRFGHCESWYTNVLLFDREYQVYPGDIVLTRSVANMTNYVLSSCLGDKIQASRPSYSVRSYILSLVQNGSYLSAEDEVFPYDNEFSSKRMPCPCIAERELNPVISVSLKSLSELSTDVINSTCSEPEDFLKDIQWVNIGGNLYRVRLRPPAVTIDYSEQTCAAAVNPRSAKRKLPTDPPRRYKKVKPKV